MVNYFQAICVGMSLSQNSLEICLAGESLMLNVLPLTGCEVEHLLNGSVNFGR